MASENEPINPLGGPTFSQRLWSEEVAIARAEAGEPIDTRDPGYEFSNGRKFSTPVGVYADPYTSPSIVSAPVISGLAEVGAMLSSTSGLWNGDPVPSITYQWKAAGVAITGANGSSYVVLAGDNGKSITCTVTATNVAGAANATSNRIYIPAYTVPVNTVAPVISGVADVGETLTATHGTWTGNPTPTYTYQWMLGVSTIVGETNSTYVVISNDQGSDITCEVTATNAAGSASATSNIISIPAAFSPLSLFASSEVGAWYDPSDLSTMFQDRAGTTPVTADGQTVGKILDKSGRGNHAVAPSDSARPLYKTDGTYHWLQFDGVDDSLSTAAIDFSGTDKMSVFSGVRKNVLTGTAIVAEISAAADSNNGTFALFAPRGITTGDYGFWSKGTVNSAAISGNDYAVPITNVLTGIGNISGDSAILRINGSQVASSATDQGAGNYGNHSMFIGRRNNTNLTLSGNIYSLIVRGALSTADEITATETWVNQRT